MARFGPIKRNELIRNLKLLGFIGPTRSGSHEIMVRGTDRIALPNPHGSVIGTNLLARLLRQANISREEWERL